MATKHTPGPWQYVDATGSIRGTGASKRCVAQTNWMLRKHHWAEHEANASLIAAAPELLEALEAVLPVLMECGAGCVYYPDCTNHESCSARRKTEAAIRKAKGE